MEEPFARIEDMAEFYLAASNKLQPQGPYILIGYSFGGLVALEMAQRLLEEGRGVALLVRVDTYPHPRFLSPGQRLWLMLQRIRRHISEMRQRSGPDAISYFVRGLGRRLRMVGVHDHDTRHPEASHPSFAQAPLRIRDKSYAAFRRYRPRFYRGKITFVGAEVNSYFPNNPTAIWAKLADEFEVKTVPAGHLEMVTTEFESLAAVLTRQVRGTLCQDKT
jgi:acetoacetyl-CoA synthetase